MSYLPIRFLLCILVKSAQVLIRLNSCRVVKATFAHELPIDRDGFLFLRQDLGASTLVTFTFAEIRPHSALWQRALDLPLAV